MVNRPIVEYGTKLFEPSTETPQRLALEGEDQTDVGAIRALLLKVSSKWQM
jgi:hypothetical protein